MKDLNQLLAHSANQEGKTQSLIDHLKNVAKIAKEFADKFGAGELAYMAGLWHDLGKATPEFQSVLSGNSTAKPPEHKSVGAIISKDQDADYLAFIISGHHGGLFNREDLKDWVKEKRIACNLKETIELLKTNSLFQLSGKSSLQPPDFAQKSKLNFEFFIRMLFSCLVDADYLDTEAHFFPQKSMTRTADYSINKLWSLFEKNQKEKTGKSKDSVNAIRHEIYSLSLAAAEKPRGFFRMTAPTGGGKTRSSMAFALKHAEKHELDRIIYAIPYTSIIEQTAEVFREIFGDQAIVEHHSAIEVEDENNQQNGTQTRLRLLTENWDAPIIVTTTNQLFESLLANKPSKCRKLHNISNSVIILDEAQTLPIELFCPILDVLKQLVCHYKVSVVFCTATQPALENLPHLSDINITEIVTESREIFNQLKRVEYQIRPAKCGFDEIAQIIRSHDQSMTIMNTRKDALALLDELKDAPDVFHLSTLLCPKHRRDVLKNISDRLKSNLPCRLVSTQVVEAGVDIDFPLVLRAIGPLDRIVQAAGRCNREGKLTKGNVILFEPSEGTLPAGTYRSGFSEAVELLKEKTDLDDPQIYQKYFKSLYQDVDFKAGKEISESRKRFLFKDVAQNFHIIEENTFPVIVLYRGIKQDDKSVDLLLAELQNRQKQSSNIARSLQPYLVNLYECEIKKAEKSGLVERINPELNLFLWKGNYDQLRGIGGDSWDPADLVK